MKTPRFGSIQFKVFAVIFALTATIVVVLTVYFPQRQIASSRKALAQQIADLWALGLPMAELQRESEETQKVTLEAARAAAQKYAVPSRSTVLLVGDRSKIEAGIRETKLGDVVILDAEGRPVAR